MRGVGLNGAWAAPGRRVLQTAPLYLPVTGGLGPVGAFVLPWLWTVVVAAASSRSESWLISVGNQQQENKLPDATPGSGRG